MDIVVNGKSFTFFDEVRDNEAIHNSFNALVKKTFEFDFNEWFLMGFWSDLYIPYVLLEGDRVVANVSVNKTRYYFNGMIKNTIQIGTVMTDPDYQGLGLSRALMEKVLHIWQDQADMVYLFANDRVINFYPKFGFTAVTEYQYSLAITKRGAKMVKLDINNPDDLNLLVQKHRESNPYSALKLIDNSGLLMFYCMTFFKEDIYYLPQFDLIAIATFEGQQASCYELLGDAIIPLGDLLNGIALPETKTMRLGFTPIDTQNFSKQVLNEEDTTLFISTAKEDFLKGHAVMFPYLARA